MLRHTLSPILLFSVIGLLIGLGSSAAEVREHAYWDLGFHRGSIVTIWSHSSQWSLLGAICGTLYALFSFLVGTVRRFGSFDTEPRQQEKPHPLLYLAIMTGTVLAVAILEAGPRVHRAVAVTALVWSCCLALAQCIEWKGWRPQIARIFRLASMGIPSVGLGILLYVRGRVLFTGSAEMILPQPGEALAWLCQAEVAALLGGAALLVIVLLRKTPRQWSFDPLRDGPVWPGVALLLLPVLGWMVIVPKWGELDPGNPRNVILIAVDTLRLDHTALARPGNPNDPRTPALRRWAATGTAFSTAISQAPWTMPAMASQMTGRYPRQHGSVSLFGSLRRSEITIAEVLREAGYSNSAVVSHIFVDSAHGFAQGFDYFGEGNVFGVSVATSAGVTEEAIKLVESGIDSPFFLFLHYFDPHAPYMNYEAWDHANRSRSWLRNEEFGISSLRQNRHALKAEDIDYLRALYDEEISNVDWEIGRLFDHLKARGLLENTAIVFVANHGEEFLERGWLGHTIHLHDELIRVPLVMSFPDISYQAPVVRHSVETRAIFATLLDYLEIDFDAPNQPASLLSSVRGLPERTHSAETYAFSEVWLPDATLASGKRVRMSALHSGEWKLIFDHSRAQHQLYNLEEDSGETADLALETTEILERLAAPLDRWIAEMEEVDTAIPRAEPSAELRDKLRALGYLDSGRADN